MSLHEIGIELWSFLDDKEVKALENFANHFSDDYDDAAKKSIKNFKLHEKYETDKNIFCKEFGINNEELDQILEKTKFQEKVNNDFETACDEFYYAIEDYKKNKNYTK